MKRLALLISIFGLLFTNPAISQDKQEPVRAMTNATLIDPGRDVYQSGMTVLTKGERNSIKAELREIRKQPYEALERGDCEMVVETFDENVILYNMCEMRVPSTNAILNTCRNLPRPLPRPIMEEEEVHVISEDVAWTVHVMEFQPRNADPGVTRREVVTIIWKKSNLGWRTVHFHALLNLLSEN